MKERPQKNSDDLSKLLQEWQPGASVPHGFNAAVWHKIDAAKMPQHRSLLRLVGGWLDQFVARPRLAAAYIAFLLIVGTTAGWTQGRRESVRVEGELAARYIQTLDPYQGGRH